MREAAVGFHCVECVAAGNRGVREARTTFGGRLPSRPYVTWVLIGLIGAGFVVQQIAPAVTQQFGMWGVGVALYGQWYRLLTAAFLHGGITHLLFNGFAMYVVGPQLERWLGHGRYLTLWLLSAVGGSVLSYLVDPGQLSVGASGAIFGLFGAILVVGRRLRLDTRFIVGLLVVNLLITFLVPGISWTAHIGGLVTGLALGATYAYLPRGAGRADGGQTRTIVHAAVSAGYAVLLAAVAAIGTFLLLG
ncbi:rhomboid family intramembrane serine protease [Marinitenerispora sediminis]|uniref:Rhomboid family intramembrane serine protease n=2 Tax=Marinitenerispora sediminis TaxID=1931232 RepID=A0A368T344_9ACTN|nr:rhomboid family intramembrane serine protease [Marinitenerispora sediminis]RCV55946.1 rhomboid family intramembrane serine protease [Marinitenerispora sediminis]RCV60428.1 rhomboid family intramembrane serine protease [Marinitenerispora sediminis]